MQRSMSRAIMTAVAVVMVIGIMGPAHAELLNKLVNGDLEDLTGWIDPVSKGCPLGWETWDASYWNPARMQTGANAIGGSGTSAFIKDFSGRDGMKHVLPANKGASWEFNMDFACTDSGGDWWSGQWGMALYFIYGPGHIQLKLIDNGDNGIGEVFAVLTGTVPGLMLHNCVTYDTDVAAAPLQVNHLRVVGHFDLPSPTFDLYVTDAGGTTQSVLGSTYWNGTAPSTGEEVDSINFYVTGQAGDLLIDNLSFLVPARGAVIVIK